jgi:hypothetical protein
VLFVLLAAPAVLAQTTGVIRGQVKDGTGGVLPGVSVEAKSPSLQGVKSATTAGDGTFRIPLLPPGEYTVTFTLASFGKVEKNTLIQLDKTVVVDATMTLATTANVTVTGEAPVIDARPPRPAQTSRNPVLTRRSGATSPRGRRSQRRPGLRARRGASTSGRDRRENNFLIDGVDTPGSSTAAARTRRPNSSGSRGQVGGFQAGYGHA